MSDHAVGVRNGEDSEDNGENDSGGEGGSVVVEDVSPVLGHIGRVLR